MKYIITIILFLVASTNWAQSNNAKGVGINTTQIEDCAILQIGNLTSSQKKGWAIPRMSLIERDAIINPANGLLIYNSTEKKIQVNIGTANTIKWQNI